MIRKGIGIVVMGLGILLIISQLVSFVSDLANTNPNAPNSEDGAYYIGYQIGRLLFLGIAIFFLWLGRRLMKSGN